MKGVFRKVMERVGVDTILLWMTEMIDDSGKNRFIKQELDRCRMVILHALRCK